MAPATFRTGPIVIAQMCERSGRRASTLTALANSTWVLSRIVAKCRSGCRRNSVIGFHTRLSSGATFVTLLSDTAHFTWHNTEATSMPMGLARVRVGLASTYGISSYPATAQSCTN